MTMGWNIEPIRSAPAAFAGMAGKINRLIKLMRIVSEMKGDGAVKVTVTDSNIVVSLTERDGNGGGGNAVARWFNLEFSPADPVPTSAEVIAALDGLYDGESGSPDPVIGDEILFRADISETETPNFQARLVYTVAATDDTAANLASAGWPNQGLRVVQFGSAAASNRRWAAVLRQTGLW